MRRFRSRLAVVASAVAVACCFAAADGFAADLDRLLFHAETRDGDVVASNHPDRPFNPASVIKVGTSWWALDRLGPDHRFSTGFGSLGVFDRESGGIRGDLVVAGGGDPDFHPENAFLVARELNRIGVRRVDGDLVITGSFWMGWEKGAAQPPRPAVQRALMMGDRLRDSFDAHRWKSDEIRAWNGLCGRRGWDRRLRPSVEILGRVRVATSLPAETLITHRSNPLRVVLRRFNVYSNNDIIRIADGLGGVEALQAFLRTRLGTGASDVTLATASGQGSNRMTAREVVQMMRGLGDTVRRSGLRIDDLLAVPGCDPGPTRSMFPRLVSGPHERTVVGKTGTLTTTDGGVVALAGSFLSPTRGEILFCVGAPGSGREVARWRNAEQTWLLEVMTSVGGAEPKPCGPELPFSDSSCTLEVSAPAAVAD